VAEKTVDTELVGLVGAPAEEGAARRHAKELRKAA
jgi:hypothetical protein